MSTAAFMRKDAAFDGRWDANELGNAPLVLLAVEAAGSSSDGLANLEGALLSVAVLCYYQVSLKSSTGSQNLRQPLPGGMWRHPGNKANVSKFSGD